MILVAILVFFGVFSAAVPLLMFGGGNSSRQAKQVQAALDSALANDQTQSAEKVIDFRKSDIFSALPLLNKTLQKMDLAPRLRSLLAQANLKWTAGTLILMSLVCFAATAYLIHLRPDRFLFSLLAGLAVGLAPFGYVLFAAPASALENSNRDCPTLSS